MTMNSSIRRVSILALLAVLAAPACTERNPPPPVSKPDEATHISEALRVRIHLNERALADDGFEKSRPALERTLADIEREYGKKSVEVAGSLYETALMIMQSGDDDRYRDAVPYMARTVDASVLAYGPMHRETAFAVHDHAYAQVLANKGAYLPAATPLYERALEIRRQVLGPEALETVATELDVAKQLVGQCRSQSKCSADDPLLSRAAGLADHSLGVFRTSAGNTNYEQRELEALIEDIARTPGRRVVARSPQSEKAVEPDSSCGKKQKHDVTEDLSWVQAKSPLYRLSNDGELSVGGFDGRPWKRISKHEVAGSDWPELSRSMDGRWIAYSTRGSANQTGLWLVDTLVLKERRVDTPQAKRIPELLFSPDGRSIGYFVSRHELHGVTQGVGVYLVDTQSGRSTFAGYPSDTRLKPQVGRGGMVWSADGSALLLHLNGHIDETFTREFHRFDMHSRTFRKIDGEYDKTYRDGEKFVDHGREIPKHEYLPPGTSGWYGDLTSPTGTWRARVDPQHRLLVSKRNGEEELVEQGGYNDCEGVTIGITGWVDDRYLVYLDEWRQFIFDPVSRRRAFLFKYDVPTNAYTW